MSAEVLGAVLRRGGLKEEEASRFVSKVSFGQECWLWTGAKTKAGYGLLRIRRLSRVPLYAHRLVATAVHGAAPDGRGFCCHACDTPNCVNPEHLSWGSQTDNMLGCYARNRRPKVFSGVHFHKWRALQQASGTS